MEEKVKTAEPKRFDWKTALKDYNGVVILIVLALVCFFGVHGFVKSSAQVTVQASIYGMIAIGIGIVMITGNIDLSVGYQAGISAVVCMLALNATGSVVCAALGALVCGAVCGVINGTIVTKIGVSPLIATIATNYIYKGLTYSRTKDGSLQAVDRGLKKALKAFTKDSILTDYVTLSVIIAVVVLVIVAFLLKKTNFGNSLYIAGDNAEAGQLAGLRIQKVSLLAYVLCGLCCGLAGFFFASYDGCANYLQGDGLETFAISAAVIGGVKMTGGKGTTANILVGILIMRMITVMLNVMKVPSSWMDLVSGVLLIAVLTLDRCSGRRDEDG